VNNNVEFVYRVCSAKKGDSQQNSQCRKQKPSRELAWCLDSKVCSLFISNKLRAMLLAEN
jgi:hypothetical protein